MSSVGLDALKLRRLLCDINLWSTINYHIDISIERLENTHLFYNKYDITFFKLKFLKNITRIKSKAHIKVNFHLIVDLMVNI